MRKATPSTTEKPPMEWKLITVERYKFYVSDTMEYLIQETEPGKWMLERRNIRPKKVHAQSWVFASLEAAKAYAAELYPADYAAPPVPSSDE